MTKPSIHLNGTSAEELHRQLSEVLAPFYKLFDAIDQAAPNARDYYVQGDAAFAAAQREHAARVATLRSVQDEYLALINHVADELDRRNR